MEGDLISRKALLETLWNPQEYVDSLTCRLMIHRIADFPAVDAIPVRHGEWIVQKVEANQTKFYCSECERTVIYGNDYFMKPSEYVVNVFPYCHCGAKMDGGKKNVFN